MKKTLIAAAVAAVLGLRANADETTPTTAKFNTATPTVSTTSDTGRLGAGVIIGEPTGASLKYWLDDRVAVDGAFGWSFHNDSVFYMQSDVLWHNFDLIPVPRGRLPVYFGVGGLVRFRDNNNDNQVGIRVPVGLSYMPDDLPMDVFVEIGPALDITPNVQGEVTGGVGVRYWF
jgi:hypothetical protein